MPLQVRRNAEGIDSLVTVLPQILGCRCFCLIHPATKAKAVTFSVALQAIPLSVALQKVRLMIRDMVFLLSRSSPLVVLVVVLLSPLGLSWGSEYHWGQGSWVSTLMSLGLLVERF